MNPEDTRAVPDTLTEEMHYRRCLTGRCEHGGSEAACLAAAFARGQISGRQEGPKVLVVDGDTTRVVDVTNESKLRDLVRHAMHERRDSPERLVARAERPMEILLDPPMMLPDIQVPASKPPRYNRSKRRPWK